MLKFEFLKKSEVEKINNRFSNEDSIDFDNWNLMSEEEILIMDAAMFVDEAYCDNKFNSIKEFANNVVEEEGDSFESTVDRINKMLNKNILKTVNL
mgnify:CR=1 FL=1|jgi:hypothetical protein